MGNAHFTNTEQLKKNPMSCKAVPLLLSCDCETVDDSLGGAAGAAAAVVDRGGEGGKTFLV